jgi:hypothetical protein
MNLAGRGVSHLARPVILASGAPEPFVLPYFLELGGWFLYTLEQ